MTTDLTAFIMGFWCVPVVLIMEANLVVVFAGKMQENSLLKLDEMLTAECDVDHCTLLGLAGLLRIHVEALTC
jgi:hypothetical protein